MAEETKKLSASRIKTLKSCSWIYWCKYHLKLPDKSNSGAERGNCVHTIFECLLNKRHKKHFNQIVKAGQISASPAIDRLVWKIILKSEILSEDSADNYKQIDEMILVGLKNDFFCKGIKLFDPEYEFNLVNDNPKYHARGFIDKWGVDHKKKQVFIKDYKSSKGKFDGEDLEFNVQALLYSVVSKKAYPEYRCIVEFIFLKYADDPIQTLEFDDVVLEGFEHYLESLNHKMNHFTYADAIADLAAKKPYPEKGFTGKLLCGFATEPGELKKDGSPKWHCSFKFAFDYYVLLDENRGFVKSDVDTKKLEKIKKENWSIEHRSYGGCPAFNKSSLTNF